MQLNNSESTICIFLIVMSNQLSMEQKYKFEDAATLNLFWRYLDECPLPESAIFVSTPPIMKLLSFCLNHPIPSPSFGFVCDDEGDDWRNLEPMTAMRGRM